MTTDLLQATAGLVDIASVSHDEAQIADHVEARLRCGAMARRRPGG